MEIREKGEIIKGDKTDPNTAVHFMALFPFFDAMVRLYEQDQEFKNAVDAVKASPEAAEFVWSSTVSIR